MIIIVIIADSNKRISEVLEEEFEDGGCLADYDKNEVGPDDDDDDGDGCDDDDDDDDDAKQIWL